MTLDTWNHVEATYDNKTLRIYVNGVVATKAYIATVTNSADLLRIAYDDPGDDEYIGAVDDLLGTGAHRYDTTGFVGKNSSGLGRFPICYRWCHIYSNCCT